MIERLFASSAPTEEAVDEEMEEDGDSMKLTSLQSITDFMNCAGRTLPDNIRLWARRNLAVARSHEVSPEASGYVQLHKRSAIYRFRPVRSEGFHTPEECAFC